MGFAQGEVGQAARLSRLQLSNDMRLGRKLFVVNFLSSNLLKFRHCGVERSSIGFVHRAQASSLSGRSTDELNPFVDRAVELSVRFQWENYSHLLGVDAELSAREAWRSWVERCASVTYDGTGFRTTSTTAEVSFEALSKRAKRPFDEAVVRACLGSKRLNKNVADGLVIWDLTAGLGRDGYLLAAAGCRCRLQEREPAVALMLADAIARAQEASPDGIATRLTPVLADTRSLACPESAERWMELPDVLYIDPMFPVPGASSGSSDAVPGKPRKRHKAMAKKDMQGLRDLTTPSDSREQELLFRHLYKCAGALVLGTEWKKKGTSGVKIVVKRHKNSPLIVPKEVLAPSNQLRLSTNRFDAYFVSEGGVKDLGDSV